MDSFREQLGEDWLRYQHHLEAAPPTTYTPLTASSNGLDLPPNRVPEAPELPEVQEVPPPPAPSSQPGEGAWAGEVEQETEESTLRWSCQSPGEIRSTLEGEDRSGPTNKSGDTRKEEEEEEEEDLGGKGTTTFYLLRSSSFIGSSLILNKTFTSRTVTFLKDPLQ